MENKTITITEEQFVEAVAKACQNFDTKMSETDAASCVSLAMNLQNMMFGIEIKKVLFGIEDENKGEE